MIDIRANGIDVHYDLEFSRDKQQLSGSWTARRGTKSQSRKTVLKRGGTIDQDFSFNLTDDLPWALGEERQEGMETQEEGYRDILSY